MAKEKTLTQKVAASGGLRPAAEVIEEHITRLLHSCVDYIEEKGIPATTLDIEALRQTFYSTPVGDLSAITPDQIKLITEAYFRGKGIVR